MALDFCYKRRAIRARCEAGSVLSPLLFLLVIDSLLEELESTGLGVSIHGHYLGSLGHADDLRGVAPNLDILEQQASIVRQFTVDNGLRLNEDKPELQEFTSAKYYVHR